MEVVQGGDNKGDLWGHVRPVQHLLLTVIDTAPRPHPWGVLYKNKKSDIRYIKSTLAITCIVFEYCFLFLSFLCLSQLWMSYIVDVLYCECLILCNSIVVCLQKPKIGSNKSFESSRRFPLLTMLEVNMLKFLFENLFNKSKLLILVTEVLLLNILFLFIIFL